MAKKFISFLGEGDYQPCKFKLPDNNISTDVTFVQEAIIKTLCMEFTEEDAICILITKEAKEKHWENFLEQLKLLDLKCKIIPVDIKYSTIISENFWPLTYTVSHAIVDQDSVIFDLTYFRYVPVHFFLILNHVQQLKHISIENIYYGAYEARTEDNVIPIFDMLDVYSVFQWANEAADFFRNYDFMDYDIEDKFSQGSSGSGEITDSILKVSQKLNYSGDIKSFEGNVFSDCLKKIKAYKDSADFNPSLLPVFHSVYKNIKDFWRRSYLNFIPSIQLYIKEDAPEAAISLLEHGIISFLLLQKGIDFNNPSLRDLLENMLACTSVLKQRDWNTESKDASDESSQSDRW